MALPYRTTGSLSPSFVPACSVDLAVKHSYAFAHSARCPTALSVPSSSSVTLWAETAPVKLPTTHGPRPGLRAQVRTSSTTGCNFKNGSTAASDKVSQPPHYPTQPKSPLHLKLATTSTGSFGFSNGKLPLHINFH